MATTDDCNNINKTNNRKYSDPYDERYNIHWEAKPIRPYRTKDEYLYAMCEDLTEWLNDLYGLQISAENFFDSLDNGVVLCKHGNRVQTLALEFRQLNNVINNNEMDFDAGDIKFRGSAKSGTFQARDNICNFIHWCRNCLKINSVLMFETDDLVLRKNDRSFVLCLLEVARRGGLVGMPVPLLVQFEREIDRELNGETPSEPDSLASTDGSPPSSATATDIEPESPSEADSEGRSMDTSPEPPIPKSSRSRTSIPKRLPFTPKRRQPKNKNEVREEDPEEIEYVQIRLSEEILKTLDERVRDLVNMCTCPNQFPMIREGEGKYRIGESQTLIFVRILRNHVMVRVGGGWDTLEHYLDKHDPCRCQAHKGGLSRSRSIPRSDSPYHERVPNRRASYQGGNNNVNKNLKSDSTSANDSDESIKSQPSKRTPEKYRPTTLQLPPRGSPRNSLRRMSPTEGSISSDSQTPSSETSNKFEESFAQRKRLSWQANKQSRSAPGSPQMGRRSRLAIPKAKTATATEEFLKKKRREAQLKSSARSRVRSAPSSPTRVKNITSELAKYDNPPSELLKRVTGSNGGKPKLSRSPSRQSRGGSMGNRLMVNSSAPRDRSLSPTMRGKPLRRASSFNSREKDITFLISRDSTGRHRVDSNSSCDSVESFKDKAHDKAGKPPKGYSPSKRIISAQKNKRSFSSGRTGYHSRENSLERNISNNNVPARTGSLQRDAFEKDHQLPKEENFFKIMRKPRSRNNSFSSEPGDFGTRICRSGRSSPTDSVKSSSSSKSMSRLRPVTPVPSNMKLDKVVTPIRKDDAMGPPSKIPMPVQHKRIIEQHQEQKVAVLNDMMMWLKTRSYDHGDSNHFSLPQSPSGRDSISPTPSARSDFHHDSGFEDNNQYRMTSPLGSVLSPNTP